MVDISPSFDYTVIRAVNASVAQSVEQGTENPRVGGSIPPGGTIFEQVPYGTCSKILPPTKESKDASKKICRWHIFRTVALPQQSDSARRHDVSCVTVILSNDSARRLDVICVAAAQSGDSIWRLPFLAQTTEYAAVAHLVERHLAKVEVASSSLVSRSIRKAPVNRQALFVCPMRPA